MADTTMALRTDKQALLEKTHGKPLDQVLRDTLEKHRGKKQQITLTGLDLEVTGVTIYNWCRELGINIDDYRRPIRDGEAPRFPLDSDDRASER